VSASSGQQRAISRWLPWIVAAAGIGATVVAARAGWLQSTSFASPVRLDVVLPDSAPLAAEDEGGKRIAFSPDGSQIAYVAQAGASRLLYLRHLDDANAQPIRGTEGGNSPHFSWDGRSILFTAEGKIKKVALTGGVPLVVADSASVGAVGEGNVVIFGRNGALLSVSADGGIPRQLARPDSSRGHFWYYQPEVLPGGRAAFVTIFKGSTAISAQQLGIVALPGGEITELGIPGANARYVPTGHILFTRGETVMAARFSLGSLRVLSPPTAVLEDAMVGRYWSATMDIAPNGTLAYVSAVRPGRRLVRLDRRGALSAVLGDSRDIDSPRLSPDGQRVAMTIVDSRGQDIWIFTIGSRTLARLTNDETSRRAVWFDGGRRIAYRGFDDGRFVIKQRLADGSGTPEVFLRTDANDQFRVCGATTVVRGRGGVARSAGCAPRFPERHSGDSSPPRPLNTFRACRQAADCWPMSPMKPAAPKFTSRRCPGRRVA
jgi:dipeptidyl aminopeptidase/acylaminoacyl peptidase